MPTYQYACTECGHAFEQVQSFSDDALTTCPECTGRLRKVFNAVGVVFKGSGFYRTDSRAGSGAGGRAGKGTKGAEGSSGDSASSSSSTGASGEASGGASTGSSTSAAASSAATAPAASAS